MFALLTPLLAPRRGTWDWLVGESITRGRTDDPPRRERQARGGVVRIPMRNNPRFHRGPCQAPSEVERERVAAIIEATRQRLAEALDRSVAP